jgi:hypothetical protein
MTTATEQTELPKFRLFPNGTSFMIWADRNCDSCVKCFREERAVCGMNPACEIENAIALACATDGSLLHSGSTPHNKADAIARRLNWDGRGYLTNNCPEFVP